MSIKFEVLGNPHGKQRPRMCVINGKTVTYTPTPTREYERIVKASYNAVSRNFFDKDIPVEVDIKAYFAIPKKNKFLSKKSLPIMSPDADNIAKVVCDALNGVAYFDDRQICKLNIEKYYSEIPKISVEVRALEVINDD